MAESRRPAAASPLEWIAAILGGLIALGLLGLIGWEAAQGTSEAPPAIVLEAERVTPVRGAFVLEIRARNLGDSTAATVQVEGNLLQGEHVVETSRATLDYLPGRGHKVAGLMFSRDPAAHRLVLRVTGYEEP